MKNNEIINKKVFKEGKKQKNTKEISKKAQLEKELNIERNKKNKNKGPNLSDIKMNQLNYYNEIAKHNIHNLMNNPTLKDIIRITSNESVLDQLKSKEQSKELSKFLDVMPLKRVERINYKCLEIGHMRKDLGLIRNPKPTYNREKGRRFAENLYEKRKREGSVKYIPVLTMDNLNEYNENYRKNLIKTKVKEAHSITNNNNLTKSNNESWIKKYRHNTHVVSKIHKNKTSIINIKNNNENKEEKDLKTDNTKLASNRIYVNKQKGKYETKNNQNNRETNNEIIDKKRNYTFLSKNRNKLNGLYNIDNNVEKEKDIEMSTNNGIKSLYNINKNNNNDNNVNRMNKYETNSKKELLSNNYEIKTNFRGKPIQNDQNQTNQQNKIDLNEKRNNYKKHNFRFFSSGNIFSNDPSTPIENQKSQNPNYINVKRSFANNYEENRNKMEKNEEMNNNKLLNKNNNRYSSYTFNRFKRVKS